MIVEKGHFHLAEKYCGGKAPCHPPPPCSDSLVLSLVQNSQLMNSGTVRLDQIMNKHRLQFLLLRFVLHMPNIISLNLNYMLIDQCKLLTLFRSMLSINAEWSTCKKNNKGMYICFYGSKKFLDCFDVVRGKKQKMVKMYFLKLLLEMFMAVLLSNRLYEKVMIFYIKKDNEKFVHFKNLFYFSKILKS